MIIRNTFLPLLNAQPLSSTIADACGYRRRECLSFRGDYKFPWRARLPAVLSGVPSNTGVRLGAEFLGEVPRISSAALMTRGTADTFMALNAKAMCLPTLHELHADFPWRCIVLKHRSTRETQDV